ncbi:MAG: transporter substrate-binding domain-containing protein [Rhodospirillaceae bacterium]|nr:transporter substrate-binding domain-containing protein [Rhodospirillaceae bacterium]
MTDLSVHGRINKSGSILAIGSRKDTPILSQILGKGLESISSAEMSVLIGAYVDAGTRDELTSGVTSIELSDDERIWLDNHNTVRVMVGSWPPFHFMEKGKPKGLALDYVRTILESHGVKTEFVPITWSDALAGISKLEDVDLLPTIARSVEREKLVNITQDYLSFPRVIFARTNDVYGSLEELHGKTVSVERGFITATLLKRDHPEINLMPVSATKDALEAVSFGKADAFVSNMAVGSFLIDRLGLTNLGVSGQTEYKSDIQAMGVRKDWPELASIINKSLAAMSETQAHDMRAKWIASETLSGDGQDAALPPEIIKSEAAAGLWAMVAVAVLIFSALAFFIRLLLRSSKGDAVALQMGTKRFRFMIIAALLLLALVVSSVSWLAYNHNKNRIVEVAGINLQTVLSSTVERLKTWVTDEKKQIARAARDPQLVELTRSLLFLPKDKQPLQFSQALAKIRTYFRNQDLTQGSRGFFIISTDGITLASMRDNNLAGQNFIATQMPDLFERVVRGEAVFIPPIRSDVQLEQGADLNVLPPTMFFAAPIVDENGTVLAVLTNRIDPAGDFTAITQTGNMGNSGETYAFDQSGLMMSSSRFEDELVRRGLLEQGQPSILNIVLTSPAANDTATLTFMAQSAVSGRAGINLDGYDDYRGVKVLGAWQWVDELGLGLTTEIDAAEALDTVGTLRNTILAILGLTLTLSAGATMFTLALGERASSSLIRAKNELEDRVTERTQELQNSETRIHTIINNASDGIIVIGEKGIIQSFSPSAERIFGYVSDEVIGKNIKMLMPEPTRSEHDGYLESYLQTGKAKIVGMNREVVGLRKDKTEFPMDLAVGGAVLDNEHIFTGMVRDITERKQDELNLKKNRNDLERMVVDLEQSRMLLEEQAAEMATLAEEQAALRDKAEEATRSKAAFLAAMSHEIRTPMNGVVGMISLLQETQLEHDQRNMMNTVQDSAFSLLQIINDILDFSKIEAGKMSVEKIPVNIDTILEGVTETLLPNVAKKKLRMALMIDPNIPDHVMSDQVRLRQILFNLAGNATKFTENSAERQGVISLTAEMVEPAKDGRIQICFSVIDNGIGMKPAAVAKLFTPFTQADQSTTRKFGGTGLGLSICKNLTELLGGQISVTSEEGKGSAFHVTLPFDIAEQADDRIAKHDLSGLNIAYAVKFDDSAEAIERYATAGGATVTRFSADEMVEGVRASAKSDPFDIVILGVMVSDEDRDAMIHALRDDKNVPGPRFVILTIDRSDLRGMVLPDTVVVEATPVRKSTFMHGIAMAAGRASPHVDSDVTKLSFDARNAPEIEAAREAGELILIAEDNITNQDVIRRQLNVLGYACEVADDGMIGLEMLKSGRYGMLLTDCHMPNMDGYELTGSLRNLELDTDTRLPVVAITANALQGEAERCLAAGMDDYLAKPLEMNKLKAMLAKWLPVDHGKVAAPQDVPETAPAKEVPPHDGVVNVKALTDMFGEDMGVVKEILGDYVQPSRDIIGEIDAGVEAHDADAVGKAGHKLKSSSRAIGADALADLCAALEQAGKGGDWGEIEKLYPDLNTTFDDVVEFIEAL